MNSKNLIPVHILVSSSQLSFWHTHSFSHNLSMLKRSKNSINTLQWINYYSLGYTEEWNRNKKVGWKITITSHGHTNQVYVVFPLKNEDDRPLVPYSGGKIFPPPNPPPHAQICNHAAIPTAAINLPPKVPILRQPAVLLTVFIVFFARNRPFTDPVERSLPAA